MTNSSNRGGSTKGFVYELLGLGMLVLAASNCAGQVATDGTNSDPEEELVTSPSCGSSMSIAQLTAINTDDNNAVIATAYPNNGTLAIDLAATPNFALVALPASGAPTYVYYAIGNAPHAFESWAFAATQYVTSPAPSTAASPWPNLTKRYSGGWAVPYYGATRGCQMNLDLLITGVPVLNSISQSAGAAGSTVTLQGINLTSAVAVNGVSADVASIDPNGASVTFLVPPSLAIGGPYAITDGASGGLSFTVTAAAVTPPPPPPPVTTSSCVGQIYVSVSQGTIHTLTDAQIAARKLAPSATNPITICLQDGPFTDALTLTAADSYETWTTANSFTTYVAPSTIGEISGNNSRLTGITVDGANNLTLSGLYIHGFGQAGIFMDNGANNIIRYNTISDVAYFEGNFSRVPQSGQGIANGYNGAILMNAWSGKTIYNLKIENNEIDHAGCFGINLQENIELASVSTNTINYTGWFSQNGVTGYNECAAIYFNDVTSSVGSSITNNNISNWRSGNTLGSSGDVYPHIYPKYGPQTGAGNGVYQAVAIELDINSAHVSVSGNTISPAWTPGDANTPGAPRDNNATFACVKNGTGAATDTWSTNAVSFGSDAMTSAPSTYCP